MVSEQRFLLLLERVEMLERRISGTETDIRTRSIELHKLWRTVAILIEEGEATAEAQIEQGENSEAATAEAENEVMS